jgi:hypothetical protein
MVPDQQMQAYSDDLCSQMSLWIPPCSSKPWVYRIGLLKILASTSPLILNSKDDSWKTKPPKLGFSETIFPDSCNPPLDSAGMEQQIIEGRYLDRKKLLNFLEKSFPAKNYSVRVSRRTGAS